MPNPNVSLDEQITLLNSQVGVYTPPDADIDNNQAERDRLFVNNKLSGAGLNGLFQGITAYTDQHRAKISQYGAGVESAEDLNNPKYFRQKFIEFCVRKDADESGRCEINEEIKQRNPELATINMNRFLGSEGELLYQLALEEERYSEEYMNAVVCRSTTHFEGPTWTQRPMVFVAGPSGCGKSFAAQSAVEKAGNFLPSVDALGPSSGNDVVAADGGIAREVSQMRKLAIQLALNKGYSGIKDIHAKSSILESVKWNVLEAAKATEPPDHMLGIVLPETFSSFANPSSAIHRRLGRLMDLKETKPIFCRVDGENPNLFQRIVAFMGSRRAFQSTSDDKKALDLNNTKIPESKAYGKSGFRFGQSGSKLAERWFLNYCRKHEMSHLAMKVTNDLVLKRENPAGSGNYVDAVQGEAGAILLSNRVFLQWDTLQKNLENIPVSERPVKELTLMDFKEILTVPPILETSAGIKMAEAMEVIRKRMVVVRGDLEKTTDPIRADRLSDKIERLNQIYYSLALCHSGMTSELLIDVKQGIVTKLIAMEEAGDFTLFFSKTKRSINNSLKALDGMIEERNLRLEDKPAKPNIMEEKDKQEHDIDFDDRLFSRP